MMINAFMAPPGQRDLISTSLCYHISDIAIAPSVRYIRKFLIKGVGLPFTSTIVNALNTIFDFRHRGSGTRFRRSYSCQLSNILLTNVTISHPLSYRKRYCSYAAPDGTNLVL